MNTTDATTPTAILDVLTRLEDLGIELISDGRSVCFGPGGWAKAPRELHDRVRECSHLLAGLLGDNRAEMLPARQQKNVTAALRRVQACEDRSVGRRGVGGRREGVLEEGAFARQAVEERRGRALVAVGPEPVDPERVDRDEEHLVQEPVAA